MCVWMRCVEGEKGGKKRGKCEKKNLTAFEERKGRGKKREHKKKESGKKHETLQVLTWFAFCVFFVFFCF